MRFGKALFDFQAKNERELSLRRGDLVELIEMSNDHNWVRVEDCQSGLQGFVPLSYIDYSVGCAVAKRDVQIGHGSMGTCKIRVGDRLQEAPILPMSKGEPITLIRRLTCQQCYEASNTRQAVGVVWSSDLEVIKQPVLADTDITSYENARTTVDRQFGQTSARISQNHDQFDEDFDYEDEDDDEEEMFILDTGERILARRQRRPRARSASSTLGKQQHLDTFETGVEQQQLRPSCCSASSQLLKMAPRRSLSSPYIGAERKSPTTQRDNFNLHKQEPGAIQSGSATAYTAHHLQRRSVNSGTTSLPRLCKAKFAYKARQKDELDLKVGDILLVVHECDDKWFIGCHWDGQSSTTQDSREMGTFPGNFVEYV